MKKERKSKELELTRDEVISLVSAAEAFLLNIGPHELYSGLFDDLHSAIDKLNMILVS